MKRENVRSELSPRKTIKAVLVGACVGLAAAAVLLLLTAVVIVKSGHVPYAAIVPAAIAVVCAGAFLGGYTAARIRKSKGLLLGAVGGVVLFLIFWAAGAAAGGISGVSTLLRLLLMTAAGAFGGVLGVNRRKKRR